MRSVTRGAALVDSNQPLGNSASLRRLARVDGWAATLMPQALPPVGRTLEDRCKLRDNNVSCRFKHEVGRSIKVYIEDLRLGIAWELLREGTFSVADVADAVGYAYLQTFYRAFKKRFNLLPASVRSEG